MKTCRVCQGSSIVVDSGKFRSWRIDISECESCGRIQANGLKWLEEADASPVSINDPSLVVRFLRDIREVFACLTLIEKKNSRRVVDMAGRYGIFTRLLRDEGVEAEWSDTLSRKLGARGFE